MMLWRLVDVVFVVLLPLADCSFPSGLAIADEKKTNEITTTAKRTTSTVRSERLEDARTRWPMAATTTTSRCSSSSGSLQP
jgi:hypothetical protein